MKRIRLTFLMMLGLFAAGCANLTPEPLRPKGVDLYVAGVQAYNAGDQRLAQARLEQATTINPELRMARSMLGDIYRTQGDYDRARLQYEMLVRLDPYESDNYYRLGVTYQFLQRVEDAIATYLRALNINPRDVKSCMNLGLCYLALDQREDAVKYLREATELAPDWADAWTNLGVALDTQGDAATAETAYKRALELNRNQNVALMNLGANLIRQGKGADAVSVMEEAIKRSDNAPTRTRYGHALALVRRFDDALAQFTLALRADPRYYPAYNERGSALISQYETGMELNDRLRTGAIDAWEASLKLYPNQPPVRQAIKQWTATRPFGPTSGS